MITNKRSFLTKHPQITNGMHVYDTENKPLGRIISMDDESFTIERGVFFPKDFTLRYDEVEKFENGKVYVKPAPTELSEWKKESYGGWEQVENINKGKLQAVPSESFRDKFETIREETMKVPLFEEELEAKKIPHQTGEVRIRKIVHTELKHVTLPLDHEEVTIERVTGDRRTVNESEAIHAFEESTVSMPIMEETAEIEKHAVLKEEVQIKKAHRTENRELTGEVRSEDVEIEKQPEIQKKAG